MSAQGEQLPDDRRAPRGPDDPNAESVGEYVDFSQPEDDSYPTEVDSDGSLIVTIGEAIEPDIEDGGFYDNLALVIPEDIQTQMATELLRLIEDDKQAREPSDKLYEEGIRRTGLGKDAPGGAEFEGASKVVHPMLTEACVDYEARIIKELWPVSGPCREKILGVVTKEKAERAKRKVEFMNFQLTNQMKEARATMESTLTQVPLGGKQYIKQWWDERLGRPRWQFVPCDQTYIPRNAADWYSSHRRTMVDTVSNVVMRERMASGMYRRVSLSSTSIEPASSKAEEANLKVVGVQATGMNVDGDRDLYEVMSYIEVTDEMSDILQHEEPGRLYPYLLTIDVQSRKILALYRDWEEDDETCEPIDHVFEFPFIPWRGSSIGLPQIVGGLSGGATGALRALLDSAHIANVQGGLILKGSGTGSQTRRAQPGEFVEIEGGGLETADIRAKVMQFNTKEPSNVLFQLLGFLVDAAKGTIRTSLDESAIDTNTNVPVGTQLSRVEEGLVVFSSIHGRIHEAFNRLLAGLHRLNKMYLPETIRVDAAGTEIMVRRADFQGPPDVQAVSDPTIYSDQQRMAQIQAIQSRSMLVPGLYNARAVEERFLKLIKIPDADELLVPAPEPHELNAVNENVSLGLGRPVTAFPEQDHLAHIETHLQFLMSPVFGQNPIIAPKFMLGVLPHIAEHILFYYASLANNLVSGAARMRAVDLMSSDTEVKAAFDKLLAMASGHIMPLAQQQLASVMPVIAQAAQKAQQMQPPQPLDPAQGALQSAQAETARRSQADQMNNQTKQQQIAAQDKDNQVRNAIAAERNQVTARNADVAAQTHIVTTELEAQSAQNIASSKLASGEKTDFSDGASLAR